MKRKALIQDPPKSRLRLYLNGTEHCVRYYHNSVTPLELQTLMRAALGFHQDQKVQFLDSDGTPLLIGSRMPDNTRIFVRTTDKPDTKSYAQTCNWRAWLFCTTGAIVNEDKTKYTLKNGLNSGLVASPIIPQVGLHFAILKFSTQVCCVCFGLVDAKSSVEDYSTHLRFGEENPAMMPLNGFLDSNQRSRSQPLHVGMLVDSTTRDLYLFQLQIKRPRYNPKTKQWDSSVEINTATIAHATNIPRANRIAVKIPKHNLEVEFLSLAAYKAAIPAPEKILEKLVQSGNVRDIREWVP